VKVAQGHIALKEDEGNAQSSLAGKPSLKEFYRRHMDIWEKE
jgi:hypothetical protein